MNKKFLGTVLLTSAILLTPIVPNAESDNISINGNSLYNVGDRVTLTLELNNVDSD